MNVVARNNVRELGRRDGQPLVFAHGYGCDQNMWRYVWPEFASEYRVILFDHVGYGESDPYAYSIEKYSNLEAYAEDALEILRELDVHDVIFVGHSVSAMIGVLAAKADPGRFASLVLIGPSPRYIDDEGYLGGFSRDEIDGLIEAVESNYLGWSRQIAPVIVGNEDRPELGDELANSFCRADPVMAAQFARVTFLSDNRGDLPQVDIPSLVLQCSQDVIAPDSVGMYVAEQMPRAQFVRLNATGHCPNLSAPGETVDAIRSFLAALP